MAKRVIATGHILKKDISLFGIDVREFQLVAEDPYNNDWVKTVDVIPHYYTNLKKNLQPKLSQEMLDHVFDNTINFIESPPTPKVD